MIIEKNKSMREKVYDTLKQMIIDGVIKPGERIIETEYSNKFQISRTPIREAIRMLELEGLVESQTTGGVIVKTLTREEISEIYKIRIALESLIIEEIIKKINDSFSAIVSVMPNQSNLISLFHFLLFGMGKLHKFAYL